MTAAFRASRLGPHQVTPALAFRAAPALAWRCYALWVHGYALPGY